MAEERLTNQDLAGFLVKKHGLGEEEAEAFIKEFFLLIEEALEKNKIAKVKGFGTFKLTEVKSRESINVNTGERFEIQEHTKVTFSPDPALRDIINKPFAHFETIVLKDGVNFDDEPEDDNDFEPELESVEKPIIVKKIPDTEITQPATEEILIIPAASQKETPVSELPADETASPEETVPSREPEETDEITELPPVIPEAVLEEDEKTEVDTADNLKKEHEQPIENIEEEEEVDESPSQPRLPLEEIIARELQETNRFFNKNIDGDIPHDPDSITPGMADNSRPSKKFMIITIILFIFICGTAVLFTYFPTFMDDLFGYKERKQEVAEVITTPEEPISMPIMADSTGRAEEIKTDIPETVTAENIKLAPEESNKDVVAKTEPPVATPKVKETPVEKQQNKPAETKKPENAVKSQVKTTERTQSDILRDNSPVRPDSTSYKITGTKTTHTIQSGETLTRVSLRFYGTKDLWPYLVMHNRSKIPNPGVVPVGLTINIPELEKK